MIIIIVEVMILLCCHRDDKHSVVLEQEVDALCVDRHGNTPLVCHHHHHLHPVSTCTVCQFAMLLLLLGSGQLCENPIVR